MTKARKWSRAEDDCLRSLAPTGKDWEGISQHFARSPSGCAGRWRYLKNCAARGIDPYAPKVMPEKIVRGPGLPLRWYKEGAAEAGCIAHALAIHRYAERREAA